MLRQLSLFSDLFGAAIVTGCAACLTWALRVQDAFGGDGLGDVYHGSGLIAISALVRSVSFVVTTLLTVGYGDIWPSNLGCRLMVMVIQALGLLLLLLIIQLALGLKAEQGKERESGLSPPARHRASGWLTPVLTIAAMVAFAVATIRLSF
ncbi:MAG TPA: ion channel [Pirellulales bacterium]|nr:ion channel [Pirellulales bacterium]